MNLLYVEDDINLAYAFKDYFSGWFNVDVAFNSNEALAQADTVEYDLILVDNLLPGLKTIDFCKQVRSTNSKCLLVILADQANKDLVIEAYRYGVDDFLYKPMDLEELHIRIQALIRRKVGKINPEILKAGDYTLNQLTREFFFKEEQIHLTRKEYMIIEFLMVNQGCSLSRYQLYEQAWSYVSFDSNTVDVHIKRIRQKTEMRFGQSLIITLYGYGYRVN